MKSFKTNTVNDLKSIYLYPSALVVPRTSAIVHTILGSCVAVCLYDVKKQIGGINHFMLPLWNGRGLASPKYGNIAIKKLYEKMINNNANPSSIVAKIFGGGEVISSTNSSFHVGIRNIILAREMLEQLRIPIVAESTGGKLGRKIIFNTNTGEVTHRFVKSTNDI